MEIKKSLATTHGSFGSVVKKNAMFIALIVISLLFQILTNGILLAPMNVARLIQQNSYILILAVGMLLCILTGNIDLSIGSVVAIVGAVVGVMVINMHMPVWIAIVTGLLLGIVIGAWQGYWIAYVKIPAFIVTLAGMLIFRGLATIILDGQTIGPFPESFQYMAQEYLPTFGLPGFTSTLLVGLVISILLVISQIRTRAEQIRYGIEVGSRTLFIVKNVVLVVVIMVASYWFTLFKGLPFILVILGVIAVIYAYISSKTVIGRHVYAIGGNEKAADLSGIKTKKVKFLVYTNMGLLSAVAGIVFSSRLNAAGPTAGVNFELDAIAACYIGGASASGGVGTIVGAVIGGLVMGVLNNGMSIVGVDMNWQQVIKGLVLLFAVAFDIINQSKK